MESILYQIFDNEYDTTPERDEAQRELSKQLCAELDKVQAAFGSEFLDHLFDLNAGLETWRNFQYYRSGFRLGAQLMLEALRPG